MQKILDDLMARAKKSEGFIDIPLNSVFLADW